jgi:hypothetical protein
MRQCTTDSDDIYTLRRKYIIARNKRKRAWARFQWRKAFPLRDGIAIAWGWVLRWDDAKHRLERLLLERGENPHALRWPL